MKLYSPEWLAGLALATLAASPVYPAGAPTPSAALKPYLGKVTYVDFWASWCAPCAESFPWLNQLKAKYGERLNVVGVNVDEDTVAGQRFLQKHPAQFPIVADPKGQLAARYAISGMPSSVILDAQGRVVHQHSGFKSGQVADYEAAIDQALAIPRSKP